MTDQVKIFLFVLLATISESFGDAIIRISLRHPSIFSRVALFLAGTVLLAIYGALLNLAPVDFASVTGLYVATLFVVFQITNYLVFHIVPRPGILVGGLLIVTGSTVIALWR